MRKRQVNVRLNEEEYDLLKTAADEVELTVSGFVRLAALDAAAPEPETDSHPGMLPAWLLSVLLYLRQVRVSADSSQAEAGATSAGGRRRIAAARQPLRGHAQRLRD